ncbi:hypothetical protein [Bdellovibrio bacteriovorus]|uniref:hypothetical protein n=1 Tax=Bdellovibrio TaxID=958 RepID=UPI0035A8B28C
MRKRLFILKFFAFFMGCYSCWLLQSLFGWTAVLAAATVGLLGTFIPVPALLDRRGVQAAIYAGTFAGMCSPHILENPWHILIVSFFGTILYFFTKPYLKGFGGKLGTIAFFSSMLLVMVKALI